MGWICITSFLSFAYSYSGQKRSSASATPLTLLKSIAPGSPSCSCARRSSTSDAAGSFSGSVANAPNRGLRSATIRAKSSFTPAAIRAATAGDSICTPGDVKLMTCVSTPASSSTRWRWSMSRWPGTTTL